MKRPTEKELRDLAADVTKAARIELFIKNVGFGTELPPALRKWIVGALYRWADEMRRAKQQGHIKE